MVLCEPTRRSRLDIEGTPPGLSATDFWVKHTWIEESFGSAHLRKILAETLDDDPVA